MLCKKKSHSINGVSLSRPDRFSQPVQIALLSARLARNVIQKQETRIFHVGRQSPGSIRDFLLRRFAYILNGIHILSWMRPSANT
jgi:hypothetical protein